MSAHNNKAFASIFDSQNSNSLKERQRLEELQRQAKAQRVKLDKQLNKQKIIMGAFLGQVLATEGDDEQMIREYFAIHFPDYLTRESDKYLFKSMIESLGGDMGLGEEEDTFVVNEKRQGGKESRQAHTKDLAEENVSSKSYDAVNTQHSYSSVSTNQEQQESLLGATGYSAYEDEESSR